MGLDIMAVHDYLTGKFLRFCNVVLGYGNAADCAAEVDKIRWAGPWRYGKSDLEKESFVWTFFSRVCLKILQSY